MWGERQPWTLDMALVEGRGLLALREEAHPLLPRLNFIRAASASWLLGLVA